MDKPKVLHELEISYDTAYGYEEAIAVMECLQNLGPSCGKKVKQFEEAFAQYCGVRYALAVSNASVGLTLAGIAAGVGPGDEVITTPVMWVSTALAYSALGFTGVFPGTAGTVAAVIGLIPLLTGLIGWCPLYVPFHFSTKKA